MESEESSAPAFAVAAVGACGDIIFHAGINVRTYLAGQALASAGPGNPVEIAEWAVHCADETIKRLML